MIIQKKKHKNLSLPQLTLFDLGKSDRPVESYGFPKCLLLNVSTQEPSVESDEEEPLLEEVCLVWFRKNVAYHQKGYGPNSCQTKLWKVIQIRQQRDQNCLQWQRSLYEYFKRWEIRERRSPAARQTLRSWSMVKSNWYSSFGKIDFGFD